VNARTAHDFERSDKMAGIISELGHVLTARPTLTVSVVVFVVFLAFQAVSKKALVPQSLPWVGRPTSGPFVETRASFSSFNNVREWLKEGYATVR
jgi:hypothetical protein